VLTELCVGIRRCLYFTNSGSVVLDHISLLIGKNLLRTIAPTDPANTDPALDFTEINPNNTAPIKKPVFPTPEAKQFTLHTARTLLQFYSPGYLTYQLTKTEVLGL